MNLIRAMQIFHSINSSEYSIEEKGMAILTVMKMPTNNSITEEAMRKVIYFLLNELFEIEEREKNESL